MATPENSQSACHFRATWSEQYSVTASNRASHKPTLTWDFTKMPWSGRWPRQLPKLGAPLRLEARSARVILAFLYAEALVERAPFLDHGQCGSAMHGDREAIEEAVLTEEDRPRRLPLVRETDLCLSFDEL